MNYPQVGRCKWLGVSTSTATGRWMSPSWTGCWITTPTSRRTENFQTTSNWSSSLRARTWLQTRRRRATPSRWRTIWSLWIMFCTRERLVSASLLIKWEKVRSLSTFVILLFFSLASLFSSTSYFWSQIIHSLTKFSLLRTLCLVLVQAESVVCIHQTTSNLSLHHTCSSHYNMMSKCIVT